MGEEPELVDELEGHDFEDYCADLLSKNGFFDVEVTKGSGDFGLDILAEKTASPMASNVNAMISRSGWLPSNRHMPDATITTVWWVV